MGVYVVFAFAFTLSLHLKSEVSRAAIPCEVGQLSPSDEDQGFGNGFGRSVAISGDYIVIGARRDNEIADQAGAAYVYRREGTDWIEHAKLTASEGEFQETFGWSVDIDSDRIVVGMPAANIDGSDFARLMCSTLLRASG